MEKENQEHLTNQHENTQNIDQKNLANDKNQKSKDNNKD